MKKWALFLMVLFGANSVWALSLRLREYALNDKCPKEKPFGDVGELFDLFPIDVCVGCDSLDRLAIAKGHEDDFKICSNRKTVEQYETLFSILKNCPSDAPMREENGTCISCSETALVFMDKIECDKCSNRQSVKTPEYPYAGNDVCELKECPQGTPLRDRHECLPCSSEGLVLSVDKETCQKCPDTYEWSQEKCVPIKMTREGLPLLIDLSQSFRVWSHFVYGSTSCDTTESITTTQKNCEQCSQRVYVDGKCVLKPGYVPPKKPEEKVLILEDLFEKE